MKKLALGAFVLGLPMVSMALSYERVFDCKVTKVVAYNALKLKEGNKVFLDTYPHNSSLSIAGVVYSEDGDDDYEVKMLRPELGTDSANILIKSEYYEEAFRVSYVTGGRGDLYHSAPKEKLVAELNCKK